MYGRNGTGDSRPIAVLVGATGSGKTSMAVDLTGWLRERGVSIEIVGADARQIYRSLSIGTAKPTLREQESVPYHMLDVAEPDETFNAVLYAEEAGGGHFPWSSGGAGYTFVP